MKKAFAYVPAPKTPARTPSSRHTPSSRRTRLAGVLALLGVMAGFGVLAARPAHTAGGPIAVNVANTPLAALPTDVAAPTQPFQYTFQPENDSGSDTSQSIVVPAHKRLVIEYVSASLNAYAPGVGGYVYLSTSAGRNNVYYYLTDPIQDFNKRSQTLRIYADPGTVVTVGATSNNSSSAGIGTDTEISGYFVNVP